MPSYPSVLERAQQQSPPELDDVRRGRLWRDLTPGTVCSAGSPGAAAPAASPSAATKMPTARVRRNSLTSLYNISPTVRRRDQLPGESSPLGSSSETELDARRRWHRVARVWMQSLTGVVDEGETEGDLLRLRPSATLKSSFGRIDFSELRTQTLFGGVDDDDDDDDDDDSANGSENEESMEDDEEESKQGDEGKVMRFSKFAVVPADAAENHTDEVLWMLENHWGLVKPGGEEAPADSPQRGEGVRRESTCPC